MSEHPLVKEWLSQLQANGYRITHARRVIVEELVKSQKALEPVDLFTIAGRKIPHWVWSPSTAPSISWTSWA